LSSEISRLASRGQHKTALANRTMKDRSLHVPDNNNNNKGAERASGRASRDGARYRRALLMLGMLPVTKASRNNVTSAASENDKAWMYARPRRVSRNLFMYARPCPLYAINRSCFVADGACSDRTVVRRSSCQSPIGRIDVLHSRDFRFARNRWSRRNFPSLAKSILNVRMYDRKPRASDVAELWTHSRQRKVTGIFSSPADRCGMIGQNG